MCSCVQTVQTAHILRHFLVTAARGARSCHCLLISHAGAGAAATTTTAPAATTGGPAPAAATAGRRQPTSEAYAWRGGAAPPAPAAVAFSQASNDPAGAPPPQPPRRRRRRSGRAARSNSSSLRRRCALYQCMRPRHVVPPSCCSSHFPNPSQRKIDPSVTPSSSASIWSCIRSSAAPALRICRRREHGSENATSEEPASAPMRKTSAPKRAGAALGIKRCERSRARRRKGNKTRLRVHLPLLREGLGRRVVREHREPAAEGDELVLKRAHGALHLLLEVHKVLLHLRWEWRGCSG